MNSQLLSALIAKVVLEVPELSEKIFPGAADEETSTPYAAFKTKQTPIRTMDGVVGYNLTFEIGVFHDTMSQASEIQGAVIKALDGYCFDKWRTRFEECEDQYFADFDIHGVIINFLIK